MCGDRPLRRSRSSERSQSQAVSSRGARCSFSASSGSASRVTGRATPRRACGTRRSIVLGQRKLLQRLVPGSCTRSSSGASSSCSPRSSWRCSARSTATGRFPWLGSQGWFALLVDVFATLVLVGVAARVLDPQGAAAGAVQGEPPRRGRPHPRADRRHRRPRCSSGTRRGSRSTSTSGRPAGRPSRTRLSNLFGGVTRRRSLERVFVWAHILLVLGVPRVPAPLQAPPHRDRRDQRVVRAYPGARAPRAAATSTTEDEAELRFGSATVADMTWKQMIDTMSCTECGRCQDVCPAYATGKELSPKLLIMGLRDQLFAEGPKVLAAAARRRGVRADGPRRQRRLRRTSSGTASRAAPASASAPSRSSTSTTSSTCAGSLVMVESRFPAEAGTMLRDLERAAEPVGAGADGARGLGGGTRRADPPARRARRPRSSTGSAAPPRSTSAPARRARSTAKLLTAAGVDFAILGPRECCTGDPARRMGDEYTFQCVRGAERRDARRGRRDEDRRELPALLQHARQRVPRLRRTLRGRAPHRAARRARRGRAAAAASRAPRRSPTTTPATWPATTT